MRLHPVVDGINGEVLDHFFHAVTESAQAKGYRINLFIAADAVAEVTALADMQAAGAIDAALLIDTGLGDPRPKLLTEVGLPFATFGRPWGETFTKHSWVDVDGKAGSYQATRYLQSIGHERVGYIGWPAESAAGEDRRAGWLAAQAELAGELLQAHTGNSVRQGSLAALELKKQGATAVVCASDSLALGALSVFAEGAVLGDELPVIGFDNTPVARAIGLSSVSQPVEQAAALVVDQIVGQVNAPLDFSAQGVLLSPSLELRKWESMVASQPSRKEI
jgi:DNA-binding LacI/PurR family transcriptional regulator